MRTFGAILFWLGFAAVLVTALVPEPLKTLPGGPLTAIIMVVGGLSAVMFGAILYAAWVGSRR